MKLYIKNISSLLLLALFFAFNSCGDDENFKLTNPDAKFELEQPSVNLVFLNFALPQNPALTVSWIDEVTNGSNYIVEMSLDNEFSNITTLGTTTSSDFTISVEDLNDAIINAGVTNFRDVTVHLRINSNNTYSNYVVFFVTTYPVDPPVFTTPDANSSYVLSIGSQDIQILNVSWEDVALSSDLGLMISYTLEASLGGTNFANPVALGTTNNVNNLSKTHGQLNDVALGIGLVAGTAGNMDLRIVARNTNQNGDVMERISDSRTIIVTPYSVTFPNLFLVGDATTPGWNNNNNNTPLFRNQNIPNNYIYTGYFNAGAFKLLEVKGQWQPQWGTNDGSTLAVNPGGGSDPGTFNVSAAGYYTYNFTTVGQGGSFTVTPYNATSATTYSTMGIIGDATANGWSSDTFMTQDPNNPHLWFKTGVSLSAGQLKFRANSNWGTNWGDNGSSQNYGTALFNSPNNIAIQTAGTYDVWFNDLDASYLLIQ